MRKPLSVALALATLVLPLAVGAGGCTNSAESAEAVNEATQAFGESTCETATLDDSETLEFTAPIQCSNTHASSTSTYGTSNCTFTYLVEYDAPSGSNFGGLVDSNFCGMLVEGDEWLNPPTNSSDCAKAHQRTHLWRHDSAAGSWYDLGGKETRGSWTGTSCNLDGHIIKQTYFNNSRPDLVDKVRVGVQAFSCSLGGGVDDCEGSGGTRTFVQARQNLCDGSCIE